MGTNHGGSLLLSALGRAGASSKETLSRPSVRLMVNLNAAGSDD